MSEQKEVIVYFGKDHNIKLPTENPEELLELIMAEQTGWFRYKDIVVKREEIKYAGINYPKPKAKVRSVKPF